MLLTGTPENAGIGYGYVIAVATGVLSQNHFREPPVFKGESATASRCGSSNAARLSRA